jgi:integrase
VEVLEPVVIEQLRALVRDAAPGACLFPFNTAGFRRRVHGACAALGLSAAYVPHSLRHGGATRYSHVKRWPVEDVMVRGRWASTKSARGYIQSLRAVQMAADVPAAVATMGAALATDPPAALRAALAHAARMPARA